MVSSGRCGSHALTHRGIECSIRCYTPCVLHTHSSRGQTIMQSKSTSESDDLDCMELGSGTRRQCRHSRPQTLSINRMHSSAVAIASYALMACMKLLTTTQIELHLAAACLPRCLGGTWSRSMTKATFILKRTNLSFTDDRLPIASTIQCLLQQVVRCRTPQAKEQQSRLPLSMQ